jgi:phage replication O-like protein O
MRTRNALRRHGINENGCPNTELQSIYKGEKGREVLENPYKTQSQVNPTNKDGFRQLPNKVWHDLMEISLTGAQFRIVLTIVDKTLGFRKYSEFISYSQFEKLTGLSRQSVNLAVKGLEAKKVIVVDRSGHRNEYLFNMHWDTWNGQAREVATGKSNHTSNGQL